jgi:hypothetical protein
VKRADLDDRAGREHVTMFAAGTGVQAAVPAVQAAVPAVQAAVPAVQAAVPAMFRRAMRARSRMRSPVTATRSPVTASGRDLRTLAGVVTDERADVPAEGLRPSLLTELTDLIRCDQVSFFAMDTSRQEFPFMQEIPVIPGDQALDDGYWGLHWACEGCNYPERTALG